MIGTRLIRTVFVVVVTAWFILVLATAKASNEIHAVDYTGKTVYAVIFNKSGQVWNGTSMGTLSNSSWSTYAVAMTEVTGSGNYFVSMPSLAANTYPVYVYEQQGASAASSDLLIAYGLFYWTGSATVYTADVYSQTTASSIASATLNATASSYNTSGTIGSKINASGSVADPWATSLPGSYTSGQAGYIVGSNLDTNVGSRLASGNVTVGGYATGQDPATLLFGANMLVVTAAHSSNGTQFTLTYQQALALSQAVAFGNTTQGSPQTGTGSSTVNYYLAGKVPSSSTLVETSTVNYTNGVVTGRNVVVSNPFPTLP